MTKVVKAGQAQEQETVVVSARMPQLSHADEREQYDAELSLDEGFDLERQYADEPEITEAQARAQEILSLAATQARQALSAAQAEASETLAAAAAQRAEMLDTAAAEIANRQDRMERETRSHLEAEFSERYLAAMTALEGAAADLRARQEEYLALIERPAFEMVLAIARQLLGAELSRAPQFIGQLIAQAFMMLKPEQVALVAVHPLTFQNLIMDDMLHDALNHAGIKPERVELEIDETLRPEQFSLRVSGMRLDYDLSSAIDEMLAHLSERQEYAQ
jgi:hypothetical protein